MADGKAPLLTGRMDRIDVHEQTGQCVILDYKSSDAGDGPEQVHRRSGRWVDLQLPLYRHLARGMGLEGPLQLGYILLPRDTAKTGFAIAEWGEVQLAEADEVAARRGARHARAEVLAAGRSACTLRGPVCVHLSNGRLRLGRNHRLMISRGELAHQLIRASAGTGKTYQLSNRFLTLLVGGVPLDQILATTFTRKAAGEILERVMLPWPGRPRPPRTAASWPTRSPAGRCRVRGVCTAGSDHPPAAPSAGQHLDSFFAQLARSFSLELGLPPGWRIVDELEDRVLRDRAIRQVLCDDGDRQLLALVHLLTKGEASRGVSDLLQDTVDGLYDLYQDTSPEAWHAVPRSKPLDQGKLTELLEQLRTFPLEGRVVKGRDGDYQCALAGDWESFVQKGCALKVLQGDDCYYGKQLDTDLICLYRQLIDHTRSVLVGRVALQPRARTSC